LYWLVFDLAIVAFAILVLVTVAKHGAVRWGVSLTTRTAQTLLEWAPLLLGAGFGLLVGLLDPTHPGVGQFPLALRAIFGVFAGFAEPKLYDFAARRWPDLVQSSQSTQRTGKESS